MFIFLITLLYQSKISKKILAVLFVYLVCMATDITADKIRALLNLDVSSNGTFGVVVSDLLMLIIVGFASKKPYLKNEYHIVFLNKIILVFIPVASIIVEYCIYISNNSQAATVASVFMILINVLVFYIFDNIVEMSFKIRETENIETMNKAYEKQLEIIKNND
jgi:hypothetical protein